MKLPFTVKTKSTSCDGTYAVVLQAIEMSASLPRSDRRPQDLHLILLAPPRSAENGKVNQEKC